MANIIEEKLLKDQEKQAREAAIKAEEDARRKERDDAIAALKTAGIPQSKDAPTTKGSWGGYTPDQIEQGKQFLSKDVARTPTQEAPRPIFEDEVVTEQKISQPTSPQMQTPNFDFGFGLAAKGLRQQETANTMAAQAESEAALQEKNILEEQYQTMQANKLQREAERAKATQEIEQLEKDYADTKLTNPNIWGQASTGGKILLALGALLSSASSQGAEAFRNGIKNAIDRDIDLQKSNLAKKRDTITSKRGIYRDMLDRYKDDDMAMLATNKVYLDTIGAELRLKQANAKTEAAKAATNLGLADWQKLKDTNDANIIQKRMELMQKSGQLSGALEGADEITKKIMKLPESLRKEALKEYGLVKGAQAAQKSVKNSFDEFSKISAIQGNMPFSEAKANAETIVPKLLADVVKSMGGNPSDRDLQVIKQFMPKLTDTVQQIEVKKSNMADFIKGKQAALNPTPILEGFGIKLNEEQRDASVGFK